MLRKFFLFFLPIFLAGILGGILFSKFALPKIETLIFLKETREFNPPLAALPKKEIQILCKKITNGIEVDLWEQKLRMCEQGVALQEFLVSTGKKESPTPSGEFNVINKSSMLYSKIADSWLPFWVGFYQDYGFHELPINLNGKRVGEDKIGQPNSLGCIRLKIGDAEKLYQWAKAGTKIIIFGEIP